MLCVANGENQGTAGPGRKIAKKNQRLGYWNDSNGEKFSLVAAAPQYFAQGETMDERVLWGLSAVLLMALLMEADPERLWALTQALLLGADLYGSFLSFYFIAPGRRSLWQWGRSER